MKVAFFGRKAMKENFTYIKWKKSNAKRQRKGYDIRNTYWEEKMPVFWGKVRPTNIKY